MFGEEDANGDDGGEDAEDAENPAGGRGGVLKAGGIGEVGENAGGERGFFKVDWFGFLGGLRREWMRWRGGWVGIGVSEDVSCCSGSLEDSGFWGGHCLGGVVGLVC